MSSEQGIRMISTSVVFKSPEVMGGTPVFAGTRVPIRTLLDYIEGGDTFSQFLGDVLSADQ